MPMTSADYTQGGITAVTADSTNWTRASTGNGPADTNVGFENVPQGRYRYTFSVPEQEDGSTVDANDVADNDRPFPIILVNGVPAKLHADNTYIEHDDGSTSEYHSSGTIVVPEGGSVQLGLVIEGGDTEEFEFQSAVITTEQGADAIYGFFEIEKIDRPVVTSAAVQTNVFQTTDADFDLPDTTFIAVPGLSFPVEAGETYKFEIVAACRLHLTPDLKMRLDAPDGAATNGKVAIVHAENAIARWPTFNQSSGNLAAATSTNDLNADPITIEGWLTPDTSGTVQLFSARNAAGTADTPVSVLQGSWIEVYKVAN